MRANRTAALLGTAAAGLGLIMLLTTPRQAFGFTQGVQRAQMAVPMGHEWITRMGAIELLGQDQDRWLKPDPKDPRLSWPSSARASETSLAGADAVVKEIRAALIPKKDDDRFAAIYKPVHDAILGERWVDIGGVNFAEAKAEGKFGKADCLDAVTQEAPDVQYDHFMRMPSDINAEGGVTAAKASVKRFVDYFVNAAMAPDGKMRIWDGGGWSDMYEVDRHYFLFGRALHLFEDSFSPDHTVRSDKDYYRKVRQVKSYLCAAGSEQHAHLSPLDGSAFYETGDVIWVDSWNGKTGAEDWSAYLPSNMRGYALAATEGTKEVWAAFIRSMAAARPKREAAAREEAQKVAAKWLGFDEPGMRTWYTALDGRGDTYVKSNLKADDGGNGTSIDECMKRDWKGVAQAKKLADFAQGRRLCTYNMLPAAANPEMDSSLHIPYDWRWRHYAYLEAAPDDWNPGQ